MSVNQEPSAPVAAPQRGWWSRNWLWFVPTLLLGLALVCCGGPALLVFGKMKGLSSSEPCQMAIKAVQNDPQVKAALGEPITPSMLVAGAVNISGESGEANLTFPVTGPKGTAIVLVVGKRVAGKWGLPDLRVTLPDGKQIKIDTSNEGDLDEAPRFEPPK